ncbi:aldehyde dehydrogenase family protein [Paraburkholderia caffeinilytica]|uniref:aldehyde dehydrogenase family protein n=1 Tax=Paraburkholderia caffeinilytica TaxID=1761016 RepID=UPI003DA024C1
MEFNCNFVMTIGGSPVTTDGHVAVINPATEEVFADAPDCSLAQLDAAVGAAADAFPGWRATSVERRREMLLAMSQQIVQHIDPLTRLLTREQGKTHSDAERELRRSAFWLAETARLDFPTTIVEDTPERRMETYRVPIGVVGAILPWNVPILLAMLKVAPALLAGNTLIVKPAPTTPLTTLKLGEMFNELLPPGVLNVISGANALGGWMTEHPGIGKISFTGSTQVGKLVMRGASYRLKRITLELGGNDAAIVLPDVDVTAIAESLFWAAFRNSGQVCIAAKRMYVHADIYEPFKAALVAYAKTIRMGDGAERGVQLGPVQNAAQYGRLRVLIADARNNGYRFLTGGELPDRPGYFVPLTILDNPPEESRIVQEEQFGPILPLLKYDDIDDVVARTNASEFGLAASIWTSDPEYGAEIARRLDTGTVWINEFAYLSPHAAFGGHKQSGFGTEGGLEGLREFTYPQTISVRHTGM